MKKKALIFGITGQDGSYLAEFLLKKKYSVHGVKRRSSSINTFRIDHIYEDPHVRSRNFFLHYGDITDSTSVSKIIEKRFKEVKKSLLLQFRSDQSAASTSYSSRRILERYPPRTAA